MILDLPGQQQLVLRKRVLSNMTVSKQKTKIQASSQIHIAAVILHVVPNMHDDTECHCSIVSIHAFLSEDSGSDFQPGGQICK
jgi:hypothetical protein